MDSHGATHTDGDRADHTTQEIDRLFLKLEGLDDPAIEDEPTLAVSHTPSVRFPVAEGEFHPRLFTRLKLLGRGASGRVYLALLNGTQNLYAVKVVTKSDVLARPRRLARVMMERDILATANHPFIVTMYASFQTKSALGFVTEYCEGGEFFSVLQRQRHRRLKEPAARFYAAEVLLALEYLHHHGFVYRDLKPENILMRADGHIALADFDLSAKGEAVTPVVERHPLTRRSRRSSSTSLEILDAEPIVHSKSLVGTPEYIAPEVISRADEQSPAVDWWTFGILIFEMLVGRTPFKDIAKYSSQLALFRAIETFRGPVSFPNDEVHISPEGKDLVRSLLVHDPAKRLGFRHGASDIKKHAWWKAAGWKSMDLIRNEAPPIVPKFRTDPHDLSQYRDAISRDQKVLPDADEATDNVASDDVFKDFDLPPG